MAEFNWVDWVPDSSRPILPTSPWHFGGVFDPQLAITSIVNHVAELLRLYDLEPRIVHFLDGLTNDYVKGWTVSQEFAHTMIFFTIACALLTLAWVVVYALCNVVMPSFAQIQPAHKKWYVVANWSKAFFLCLHCLSLSWWYYSILHYRCVLEPLGLQLGECTFAAVPEQGQWTKYVSAVYVSTDLVALYMVPKLPHTTVVHHWASFFLLLVTSMIDLSTSPVFQKVCMYGFFSTLAFNVNFFLAERVCHYKASWLTLLSSTAAATYAVVCFFNWGIHLVWMAQLIATGTLTFGPVLWFLFMALLIRDDLILMGWLWTYNPAAPENVAPARKPSGDSDAKKEQ